MLKKPLISIIIPVYNENNLIGGCLKSLEGQTYRPFEIILIDDGSKDGSFAQIEKFRQISKTRTIILKQDHKGPGVARNLGVSKALGEILVFVDADMTFDKDFVKDLTLPIIRGNVIGTFSKNEYVENADNNWSRSWNINKNLPYDLAIPRDYPERSPVFRAVLKNRFKKVDGFDTDGEYTDDWSLSAKLNEKSHAVRGANYYHRNPSTIGEVYGQARWIGKNRFISGSFIRKIRSLIFYSFPFSFFVGVYKSLLRFNVYFLPFKIVYDLAIFTSVVKSFFGEPKFK